MNLQNGKKETFSPYLNLLTNFENIEDPSLRPEIIQISLGNYGHVLSNYFPSIKKVVGVDGRNLLEKIWNSCNEEEDLREDWMLVGIAALLYFVQCNWTGPVDSAEIWPSELREEASKRLKLDDECNDNASKPELLDLAKIIFSNPTMQRTFDTCAWWELRSNFLHISILDEPLDVLFHRMELLVRTITASELLKNNFLSVLFNVEAGLFHLRYRRVQCAEEYLEKAREGASMTLKLEGAMGKRTKFQKDSKAQLCLDIRVRKELFPFRPCPQLPKPLELNDELRLDVIAFEEERNRPELGSLEESVVLAKCFHLLMSQPKDKLADEEIHPYLNTVIEGTKNWALLMAALHQRCTIEMQNKRTIERSMGQIEKILELVNSHETPANNRMDLFFASGLKPIWAFKQTLADSMLSLGLVKGALDIYLELGLWEDVIVCYTVLELRHKAAEIIRQEIEKKPSVKLWCLLGDATQEPEHYETAWKLSKEKSSRAQRHWGFYYFAKKNYTEAIPHLKMSVELNNIQEHVWIRLGFAALQIEDWKLAASAYRRYCNLEQQSFEAWNNLAKAYVKMGDKERAWKSLQDAIKCNYDRWEVWDNLMVVSVDVGHFSEVIRCYHRILDLKGEHVDVQVLEILGKAVAENRLDCEGNETGKLLPKVLELLGRLTSIVLTNSEIWRIYGELTILKGTDLDAQKSAQYLQKSHRALIADEKWSRSVPTTEKVLDLSCQLANAYLNCYENCSIGQKRSILGSAKLAIKSIIATVKKLEFFELESVRERFQVLDKLFEKICQEFDKVLELVAEKSPIDE